MSLIIWDEAVDLTIKPFGSVTVVFGSDFQQILPVVPKGARENIIGQCI